MSSTAPPGRSVWRFAVVGALAVIVVAGVVYLIELKGTTERFHLKPQLIPERIPKAPSEEKEERPAPP